MSRQQLGLERWVTVIQDCESREVEVVAFENFTDLLDWQRSEEYRSIVSTGILTVASMTEKYYLYHYSQEHKQWWKKIKQTLLT